MQYRQGDVLLEVVDAVPVGAKIVRPKNGQHVLAEGEATGHAHTVEACYGTLYEKGGVLYLKLDVEAPMRHQEHAAVALPQKILRKVPQMEWSDAMEPRQVLD
jgi:hypothetical protein